MGLRTSCTPGPRGGRVLERHERAREFCAAGQDASPSARYRTDFGPRRHGEVHNLYGMQMARASQEGRSSTVRTNVPSSSPGRVRRNPAPCPRLTGDNSSNWDHLNDAVQMLLNLSSAACPSAAGGRRLPGEHDPELFVRWLQFATFTPFFRKPHHPGRLPRNPGPWGPKSRRSPQPVSPTALSILLPYLYGRFAEARDHGTPIMRPLLWHYQNDPVAVTCGDQFLPDVTFSWPLF